MMSFLWVFLFGVGVCLGFIVAVPFLRHWNYCNCRKEKAVKVICEIEKLLPTFRAGEKRACRYDGCLIRDIEFYGLSFPNHWAVDQREFVAWLVQSVARQEVHDFLEMARKGELEPSCENWEKYARDLLVEASAIDLSLSEFDLPTEGLGIFLHQMVCVGWAKNHLDKMAETFNHLVEKKKVLMREIDRAGLGFDSPEIAAELLLAQFWDSYQRL